MTRQSLEFSAFVVPGPLPPQAQRTETYTCAKLELFIVPDTDLERYLRRALDYEAYRDRYLASTLGVEEELQRRIDEVEARTIVVPKAEGEVGGERGRGGRSQRAQG